MTTEPKFFSRNRIDEDGIFTVSHAFDQVQKLFDRDFTDPWETVGADNDATPISIEVEFPEARDVDTIFVAGHNLIEMTAYYWDGTAYVEFGTESTISEDFTTISGTLVSTTKVKLEATATQTPDEEKQIGELIACALALDLGRDLKSYEVTGREKVTSNNLGDGSIHQVFTFFSQNRTQKYEANIQVEFLPEADLIAFLDLKNSGEPVLWQPESSARPDQLYEVIIFGVPKYTYSNSYKPAGYTLSVALKER